MPKLSHEALVHLVRAAPELILELLQRELGLELPAQAQPRITAAELVDLNLAEYRADAVITLGPDEAPTEAFVVEAQNAELAARVESCQDLAQLERWAERVLTATNLDDIFAAP